MKIISLFAHFPIRSIQHHMRKVHQAMQTFPSFLEAVFEGDWPHAQSLYTQILKMEEEAKRVRYHILLQLTLGHLKRISCTGIFELLGEQHKMSEGIKQLAAQILANRGLIPHSVAEHYYGFIYAVLAAIEKARGAVDGLDQALKRGLESAAATRIKQQVEDLEQLSREIALIHEEIKGQVSHLARVLPPTEFNFLSQVFERTGKLASQAQLVGYQLQQLVA